MKIKKPGMTEGGIKHFFVMNVEKMVLGAAVVMVVVFLVMGLGEKPIDEDRRPAALESVIGRAENNMSKSTWLKVVEERFPEPYNFHKRAEEDSIPIQLAGYPIPLPWRQIYKKRLDPRKDPTLFAVTDLEVRTGVAAIALKDESGDLDTFGPGGRSRPGDEDEDSPDLTEEQLEAYRVGFLPTGGAKAAGAYFASVLGLAPVQRQRQEYNDRFLNHIGHDDQNSLDVLRDQPNYIYFYLERQEVLADGTASEWTKVSSFKKASEDGKLWLASTDEVAMEEYLDPKLSSTIPPIMLEDPEKWGRHSKIPRREEQESGQETTKEPDEKDPDERTGDVPGGGPDLPGADPGADGAGGEKTGHEKTGDKGDGATDSSAELMVEYKLFRVFDFTVEPGKVYRYRVQLLLEDPNDPQPAEGEGTKRAPEVSELDQTVIDRLKERRKQEKEKNQRIYWRETPWSEPSEPVQLPPTRTVLAGTVVAEKCEDLPDSRAKLHYANNPLKDCRARVLALVWDPDEAVWVPAVREKKGDKKNEVFRGSVVDFTENVWIVDPVTLSPRLLEEYPVQTGSVVLDLRGGELLPRADKKRSKLTAPGEILLLDGDGNLVVQDELDDADTFRKYYYESKKSDDTDETGLGGRKDDEDEDPFQKEHGKKSGSKSKKKS